MSQPDAPVSAVRWTRREKVCVLGGCAGGMALQGVLTDLAVPWLGVGVVAMLAAGVMVLAFGGGGRG